MVVGSVMYILIVANLIFLIIALGIATIFLVVTLGKQSSVLNSFFLLLSILMATVYPALLGQTILEASTKGSVFGRLQYIAVLI